VLVVAGVAYGLWRGGPEQGPTRAADLLTYRVQPLDLEITALETGSLESASSIPVYSEVEEKVAIVSLVPEGTRVEAGDVVVELESTALRTRLTEQQILVEKARAALSQAQQNNTVAKSKSESDVRTAELAVEFAQLDLRKYLEGDYPLELRTLQVEVQLAEEELERARAPLATLEELRRDGYMNESEFEAERFRAVRAESRLAIAKERQRVLKEYSFPRQNRDLESKVTEAKSALERVKSLAQASVEQAETNFKAQESALRLEEGKLARLEGQIAKCTLRAPQSGIVVYPFPEDEDMVELIIKEGTEIRRRQHVFSIPDTDVLQIAAAFNEAVINDIRPGLPARVRIDVGGLELQGEVKQVSSLADPQDWRRTTVKFYQTRISISEPVEGLRPGMSAMVEILIDRLEDVLAIPVQSVVQRGDDGVCFVLEGGVPVLRKLKLGKASIEHIAVLGGLRAGELVVLSPDEVGIPADAFAGQEDEPIPFAPSETPPDDAIVKGAPAPATEKPVDEVEYKAVLVGPDGVIGEAEYEIQSREGLEIKREFQVEVRGGVPNATWEVTLDDIVVGSVTLDGVGWCKVEWSTKKGTMLPEFPLGAGPDSKVTIGPDLVGALAR
jgi:HlyD family secretion protein